MYRLVKEVMECYYTEECKRAFIFARTIGMITRGTTAEEMFEILIDLIEPGTPIGRKVIMRFCYNISK